MSNYFIILIFLLSPFVLFSEDLSSPSNGNLYNQDGVGFSPSEVITYRKKSDLNSIGLTLIENRIYPTSYSKKNKTTKDKTTGSDITTSVNGITVVLTGNSSWYPHGILGDKNESTGFKVFEDGNIIGEFQLDNGRVFETLRATIADIVPENSGDEILLTVSDKDSGARIEIYSLQGKFIGGSEPIGQGFRWLHILGVAPLVTDTNSVVVVETPHINGIVKYYGWDGRQLKEQVSLEGFSSHRIGSTNLNMALISDLDGKKGPELLLPSSDFKSLNIIKVIEGSAEVIKTFDLPSRLLTNIYFNQIENSIWIGCSKSYYLNIR